MHGNKIEQNDLRLKRLEIAHGELDLMVKNDMMTYAMVQIAINSASKEYDLKMNNFMQKIKEYIDKQI